MKTKCTLPLGSPVTDAFFLKIPGPACVPLCMSNACDMLGNKFLCHVYDDNGGIVLSIGPSEVLVVNNCAHPARASLRI
jgi:hypothetical protein